MTQKEILEGNKLIAVFMGLELEEILFGKYVYAREEFKDVHKLNTYYTEFYEPNELLYDFSWDWLMPVVEKICRLRVGDGKDFIDFSYPRTFGMLNTKTDEIMVRLNGFSLKEASTLIEALWKSIVEFIKWYNELSNKQK